MNGCGFRQRNLFLTIFCCLVLYPLVPALGRPRYYRSSPPPSSGAISGAQRQVAAAAVGLKQAQAKFRTESRQLQLIRKQVQDDHSQDANLVAAKKKWDESKKELAKSKASILDKLKVFDPKYKSTLKERDTLKSKLDNNEFDDDTVRETALKRYSSTLSQIAALEKEAIAADELGAALQKEVHGNDESLRQLVKKREVDIDDDSRLVNVKKATVTAKAELDAADTKLAVARQQLASAQINYQRQLSLYANRHRHYRRY